MEAANAMSNELLDHPATTTKHKFAGNGTKSVVPPQTASIAERQIAGRELRDSVPLESHGRWHPGLRRRDPIDLLVESSKGRVEALLPIRYGRMLVAPFAFLRGSAAVMADDLSHTPATGVHVQACGDCHAANFGGFATPERNIVFDINDFDETSPAPWEWDVKRLVASIVLAARSVGLSDSKGRDCAETAARSYREHMREFSRMDPLRVWYANIGAEDIIAIVPKAVQKRMRKRSAKVTSGTGSELNFPTLARTVVAQTRITGKPPVIFHPEEVHAPETWAEIEKVLHAYRETLADDRRMLLDRYRLVDVAVKVVGVGSVGRLCSIVLMMSEANDPLFLQCKEAGESVLEPYAGKNPYKHHGQRVVMGQRLMQPASDIFWAG